jgi:5-methylcytosine-specific restriction enzyme subunit McrC
VRAAIVLEEWGRPVSAQLNLREAQVVRKYPHALRLEPTSQDRYNIHPQGGFVGSIRLSEDVALQIRPKLPLDALGSLLSLAYDLNSIPLLPAQGAVSAGELSSWFTSQLIAEVQRLVRADLRNDYKEVESREQFVRGRLLFRGETLDSSGRTLCRYAAFTADHLRNQIIAGTLRSLEASALLPSMRAQVTETVEMFANVEPVFPTQVLLDSLEQTSLFKAYEPVLNLIQLYVDSKGTAMQSADIISSGFLYELHKVFERAVFNALRRRLGSGIVRFQPEFRSVVEYVSGSPDLRVSIKPDVTLLRRPTAIVQDRIGAIRSVIDAKYRRPTQRGQFKTSFRNDNLYQIIAYAHGLRCPGVLVYPKIDDDIDITYRVNDLLIRILTVDLSSKDLEDFDRVVSAIEGFSSEELRNAG